MDAIFNKRGYRKPGAPPPDEPPVERLYLNEADLVVLEFLDRHGHLPSHYLRAHQIHLRTAKGNFLNRLTAMFYGSKQQGRLIFRPRKQKQQEYAFIRPKVYGITLAGRGILHRKERRCAVPPTRSSWFLHDLMQAHVAASFELTAQKLGYRYVTRSEILTSKKCGEARGSKRPMRIPLPGSGNKSLIPDDLFALENAERRRRYFWLEIDRDTESMDPEERDPEDVARYEDEERATYFGDKLRSIAQLLHSSIIRRWWGIAKPYFLVVTTTLAQAHRILNKVRSLEDPEFAAMVYVKVEPHFGDDWQVPKAILEHLLKENWMTVNGPRSILAQDAESRP